MTKLSLVTKLQIGHALVLEALLPRSSAPIWSAPTCATPSKLSFADSHIIMQELVNEGSLAHPRRDITDQVARLIPSEAAFSQDGSMRCGPMAGNNPWRGGTLGWRVLMNRDGIDCS